MRLYEMLKARKIKHSNDFLTAIYANAFGGEASWHEYTGTLPYTITSDGTSITNYTIKGNMEQDPITPTECGVRTDQLFDKNNIIDGGPFYPVAATAKMVASNNTKILLIPCEPNTTYTVSRTNAITKRFLIGFLTSADIYVDMPVFGVAGSNNVLTVTSTSDVDSRYLCLYYAKSGGSDSSTSAEMQEQLAEVMINKGATAKPYEPYGFKIPILSGGTTTNIYIGDAPLRKSIDGSNVYDEISSNGTLTRRVDSNGAILPAPTTTPIIMPSIPTTAGTNTISVDTPIQPSEVYIKWKG